MVSDAVSRVHTLPSLSNTAVGKQMLCLIVSPKEMGKSFSWIKQKLGN